MNICDKCGPTTGGVRLLPTSRGKGHGNMILCFTCFQAEMRYRLDMVKAGTWSVENADIWLWQELKPYQGE